jgi:hypothetical protein
VPEDGGADVRVHLEHLVKLQRETHKSASHQQSVRHGAARTRTARSACMRGARLAHLEEQHAVKVRCDRAHKCATAQRMRHMQQRSAAHEMRKRTHWL